MRRLVLAAALVAGCTTYAPPMDGVCTDITPEGYSGSDPMGPSQSCLWRGHRWSCTQHGEGYYSHYWVCTDRGPAPAEMVK